MSRPHLLFVTGKLAEPALRRLLAELAPRAGFDYQVAVLPITVVALATTAWISRHLKVPAGAERIVLPGLCQGDPTALTGATGLPVDRGPKDILELPEYFGDQGKKPLALDQWDIEILAEINYAPRLDRGTLLAQAEAFRAAGADVIDLGCDPGGTWTGVGDAVRALRDCGLRVSIDSLNIKEIADATRAGAELALSVNSTNRAAAGDWGCEVVAIPDVPAALEGLDQTVNMLTSTGVPFRIDPILEPIAFGFAASLGRYLDVRRRYPEAAMMMGIGNLTELTDVDSAGVNVMLLGFCQELGIRSVLTTEVINWCRSCVRELDRARRLVYHACRQRVLPKNLAPELVLLRDPRLRPRGEDDLRELSRSIADRNFRLFAERGLLYVLNHEVFLKGTDPFALFDDMLKRNQIDPSHAFYLGYEMAKAVTALTLGKNYIQDQALRWGFLTEEEEGHRNG